MRRPRARAPRHRTSPGSSTSPRRGHGGQSRPSGRRVRRRLQEMGVVLTPAERRRLVEAVGRHRLNTLETALLRVIADYALGHRPVCSLTRGDLMAKCGMGRGGTPTRRYGAAIDTLTRRNDAWLRCRRRCAPPPDRLVHPDLRRLPPGATTLHGSTPRRWGNCRGFLARQRSGTLPRLKAPCMEARPRRWGSCRHFPARQRSGTLPRLKAPCMEARPGDGGIAGTSLRVSGRGRFPG